MKIKNLVFKIKDVTFNEVLEYIEKKSASTSSKTFLVTINTEIIMLARDDEEYLKVLKSADLAVCDGIGVVWAGSVFGKKFNERAHGVDLVEKVCEFVAKKPITVGFLGGRENVALKTADCLKSKYPNLKIAFAKAELPGLEVDYNVELGLKNKDLRKGKRSQFINQKSSIVNHKISADILFVAYGSPKQEKWIYENLPKIDTKVAIGVGGAFDFISGKVRRAPKWVRRIGLEWLFRLIIQPWRVKRQMALPKFILLVIKERLFS